MDNELIREKNWWQQHWKWLVPVFLFLLFLVMIINAILNVRNRETESGMAFNKEKWETKNGSNYPYRNKMVKELMDKNTLKRLKKEEVINMLGEANRTDKEYLFYEIAQERLGFFPLHTKTLVIKLSNDSTANKVMIHQ